MAESISSVLFVCLGNICRSPSAEAVFRQKAQQANLSLLIDSAGTQGFHTGSLPDDRSREAGESRGYNFDGIKCRKVDISDYDKFDIIIAMDEVNLRNLQSECPQDMYHKLHMFMSFSDIDEDIVPDPYYGGKKGFEYVLDLIESASDGLINYIKRR